jgi:hypothetical protein
MEGDHPPAQRQIRRTPLRYFFNPGKKEFVVKNIRVVRKDIKLTNNRNLVIECSFFQPKNMKGSLPCVIYLHGNSSSRMEALQTIDTLLPQKIQMFCFDFSGNFQKFRVWTIRGGIYFFRSL